MSGVDVACLHVDQIAHQLVRRLHTLLEEGDNDSVELFLQHGVSAEQLLVQEVAQNADKLVVDQRDTLQTGILQSPDLVLDNQLESSSTNEQCRRGTRRVVEDCSNVDILHHIEGIHCLDTVRVKFMVYEADTGTTRQFNAGQLLVVSFQDRAVFIAEFCDDVEDNVGAVAQHRVTKLRQLRAVLLKRGGNSGFDVRQGLFNVHHKNLAKVSQSVRSALYRKENLLTKFNFLAKYGVPQYEALLR